MTDFEDEFERRKREVRIEFDNLEKHGQTSCKTCNQPLNKDPLATLNIPKIDAFLDIPGQIPETTQTPSYLKELDARIEQIWKSRELNDRPTLPMSGNIPVIGDIEYKIAEDAIEAISSKYNIGKHDQAMFRRAQLLKLYWEQTCKFEGREVAAEIFVKTKIH